MRCAAENVLLSPREIEIAGLVRHGLKNREIADALGIRPQTVKQHLAEIYDGLNIDSRVELAVWCEQHPEALRGAWCESPPDFRPRAERKGPLIESLVRKVA